MEVVAVARHWAMAHRPRAPRRFDDFDEKIRALYAKGMTTRDIPDIVPDRYGVEVSPTLVVESTADLTAWLGSMKSGPLAFFGTLRR